MIDISRHPKEKLHTQLNAAIDKALEADTEFQEPRGYLGGSRLGLECHRQLAYEYFQARENRARWWEAVQQVPHGRESEFRHRTPHSFQGRVLRRFRVGHWCEDEVAALLRLTGFDLATGGPNGKQFGFYVAPDPETGEARMAGHCDGRIEGGPLPLPYPLLWENKVMKSSKWRECVANGVKAVYPVYFYQCQTYMAYFELRNTLFTAYNSDTSEIYPELIPFDRAEAQWATDRGVAVLEAQAPEQLPRHTNDPSHFLCKWCDFADRCWKAPDPAPAEVGKPAWLAGG